MRVEVFKKKLGESEDPIISPEDAEELVREMLINWRFLPDEKGNCELSEELLQRQHQHGTHTIRALIAITQGDQPRPFWQTVRAERESDLDRSGPMKSEI